jgi:hypothetical protein
MQILKNREILKTSLYKPFVKLFEPSCNVLGTQNHANFAYDSKQDINLLIINPTMYQSGLGMLS